MAGQKVDTSNWVRLARAGAINLTLLNLSAAAPRSPKKWLFGHQAGIFAGNTKYMFLWLSLYRPDIEAVWMSHTQKTHDQLIAQGLRSTLKKSSAGIRAALQSGVFFYCHSLFDTNARLSKGAYLVNLWHGVGLKATMFGDKTGIMHDYRANWSTPLGRTLFYEYLKQPDLLVTTSEFTQAHFADQFILPPERCPPLGYPRLDAAADERLRALAVRIDQGFGFEFKAGGFDETYVYMPTWRDTGRDFLEQALPDWDRMAAVLKQRNAVLYVKLHPWTFDSWPGDRDNIRLWPGEVEVYTYLDQLTGLITDYSSIHYDYLFVKRTGSILYTFDYDNYVGNDHSLLYPFDDNTAGIRADTFEQLCETIESGAALEPSPAVDRVREKFWGDSRPPVSGDIAAFVEARLAERR
ncbi:CDP-glycerol glycerophosphotransferase family protein [Glacieibacterium sp.]|uniref:CDP-glycerol glycerophosphotransferase family protein n=1 Tax=Glacieibacterium sp. TaxID=2860237 RepID=UPI003AFFC62A